jgi:putative FmdB family regulatory protein
MPTYEYKCENCDKVFEVRQRFSDEPLTTHEECGGHVHRLLSAPAFVFKGSGWYITDYGRGGTSRKESAAREAGAKESAGKDSAGEESAKTESKSESKSESQSDSGGSKSSASESSGSSSESSPKSDTKSETSKK